jgi:hypothetical protein
MRDAATAKEGLALDMGVFLNHAEQNTTNKTTLKPSSWVRGAKTK